MLGASGYAGFDPEAQLLARMRQVHGQLSPWLPPPEAASQWPPFAGVLPAASSAAAAWPSAADLAVQTAQLASIEVAHRNLAVERDALERERRAFEEQRAHAAASTAAAPCAASASAPGRAKGLKEKKAACASSSAGGELVESAKPSRAAGASLRAGDRRASQDSPPRRTRPGTAEEDDEIGAAALPSASAAASSCSLGVAELPPPQEPAAAGMATSASQRRLNLLEDGPWLAHEFGLLLAGGSSAPSAGSTAPSVLLDMGVWKRLWSALPASTRGSGKYQRYFGLLYGSRETRVDGAASVRCSHLDLLDEVFTWEADAQLSTAGGKGVADLLALSAAMAEALDEHLEEFLRVRFEPWAAERRRAVPEAAASAASVAAQGAPQLEAVAWLCCNDGDAFSLPAPLLDFGSKEAAPGTESWRSMVAVVDRAKSTAADPSIELVHLAGEQAPQRLLFDIESGL